MWLQVRQQEHAFLREGRARGVDSCRQFMQQMGYREYARYLSFHFPFTHERSLLEHLCFVPWRLDQRLFKVGPTLCLSIASCSGVAAWQLVTWHKHLSLRCNQKAIGVLKIWSCSGAASVWHKTPISRSNAPPGPLIRPLAMSPDGQSVMAASSVRVVIHAQLAIVHNVCNACPMSTGVPLESYQHSLSL